MPITIGTNDFLFDQAAMTSRVDPPPVIDDYIGGDIENDDFTCQLTYEPEDTATYLGPYTLEVISKPESINIVIDGDSATLVGRFNNVFTDLSIQYFKLDKTYETVGGFGLVNTETIDEVVRYSPSMVLYYDYPIVLKGIDDLMGDIEEITLYVRIYNEWTIGRDNLVNLVRTVTEPKDARSSTSG